MAQNNYWKYGEINQKLLVAERNTNKQGIT